MLKRAEGIVIRTTDYGETDKILTVFTRESGKLGVMARGAKKTRSRLAAVSQLLNYGYFLFYQGNSSMSTLNSGELVDSYRRIKQDLESTAYASYMVELLDKLTEPADPNPYLFELLKMTLEYLSEGKDHEIITRIFEVKMLQAAGYRPQVDACISCGSDEGPFLFSVREGGILCQHCRHHDTQAIVLTEGAAKLLRLFQHFDLKRLGNISVSDQTKEQMREVLYQFIVEHTGLQLKSRRFLDQFLQFPE